MANGGASEASSRWSASVRWILAILLMLLSVMSYLDRQIAALLIPNLHRDLHLTDVQIGTLLGPAFIVPYLTAMLLAAPVVDRVNKVAMIALGVGFWSVMTFSSGFARSYQELLIFRAGLAIGEAMLGPAAVALIGDLFDENPKRRTTATTIFLLGSCIGASGSAAFGAFTIQMVSKLHIELPGVTGGSDWRLTLMAVSIPALILGLLLLVLGRGSAAAAPAKAPQTLTGQDEVSNEDWTTHLRKRGLAYLLMFVGVNLMVMAEVSLLIWGPVHLMRRFAQSQVAAGYQFGSIALAFGLLGTLGSSMVLRRLGSNGTTRQFTQLALIFGPLGVGAAIAAVLSSTLYACLALLAVAVVLLSVMVTFPMQYIQVVTPRKLKGRVAIGMYVVLYLLTSGLGPMAPPAITRLLGPDAQIGQGLAVTGGLALLFGVPLLLLLMIQGDRAPARRLSGV